MNQALKNQTNTNILNLKAGISPSEPQPKKAKPRQQHYLPKGAYLQHFQCADKPGKIYLYDRRAAKPENLSIDKIGRQRDLYTFINPEGEKDYRIETELLGALDSGMTTLLARLNAPVPAIQVNPFLTLLYSEFANLCLFTSFQMMRTPAMIQQIEDSTLALMKKIDQKNAAFKDAFLQSTREAIVASQDPEGIAWTEQDIENSRQLALTGEYDLKAEDSSYFMGTSLELAQDLIPGFMMKELILWKAPPGKKFTELGTKRTSDL